MERTMTVKKQNKLFTRTLRKMLKQTNIRRSKIGYLRHAARKLGATPPVMNRNNRHRQSIRYAVEMEIRGRRRQQNNG